VVQSPIDNPEKLTTYSTQYTRLLNYLACKHFDFERTWWELF